MSVGFFDPTTKIGRLRSAALRLLRQHEAEGQLPTSGRFLFYELVQLGIVSKQRHGARRPDQDLTEAIFDLRDAGVVPWDWIVDETRSIERPLVGASVRDWVLDILADDSTQPMLDPWAPGRRPLVLTESRSLAGVLRAILRRYCVTFAATNGQVGGFLRTDVAPLLEFGDRVLYLGDLDLAGVRHIEANTRDVLERLVGRLSWERLALTPEQVDRYRVPPVIKNDHRYKHGNGVHEAYETEALSQGVIVDLVRDRLDALLAEPMDDVLERQAQQKAALRDHLERL